MSRGLGRALTLGQMLDEAAARDPAHEAIVFRDERVSYGQLKARADAFALGLIALGLERGDHVVLWMPNRVEWNVAHLGIAKAGCVTVTCNSRYKALEVEYVLRQSDAKALILADRFDAAGVDYLELLREIDASSPPAGRPAPRHRPGLEGARRVPALGGSGGAGAGE
jgi:fatty-acyl-CoA synthase